MLCRLYMQPQINLIYTADCSKLIAIDLVFNNLLHVLFQFVTFCEKLSRVMKLDEIADDVGLDLNGDAMLARGEQLVKLEARGRNSNVDSL